MSDLSRNFSQPLGTIRRIRTLDSARLRSSQRLFKTLDAKKGADYSVTADFHRFLKESGERKGRTEQRVEH